MRTAGWAFFLICAGFPPAVHAAGIRQPLGVYAHVDVADAIGSYPGPGKPTTAQLHTYLRGLYASLLADSAIAGIALGAHWDQTQIAGGSDVASFDWSYLDDAFTAAAAAQKTVQLILTPGFDSPAWLLAEIPSCDSLFSSGSALANCGTVTFVGYPEAQRSDGNVLPLPWNSVYQAAWGAFLTNVNARYGSNPAFIAIAIAGPMAASDEMIFPTSANDTAAQPSGKLVDDTWAALLQHSFPGNAGYQNNDQAIIDAWKQAIDAAEAIFTGVTLFIGADAGNDFPSFSQNVTPHPDNTLFAQDCSAVNAPELMSCEAKTEILSYFITKAGPNAKATQVGGMTASSLPTGGDIGIAGVKLLTALTPPQTPLLGGAEFDKQVSSPGTLQQEGCPNPNGVCAGLTAEEGAYNVMTHFFSGTAAAGFYGGPTGTERVQYLDVPLLDLQYALATACPAAPSPILGYISLQDLYARASRDLFAMANQTVALPPPTCLLSPPAPAITLVANAEGENPVIAPNTWVEIKGSNLAPVGVSSPDCSPGYCWQASDFTGAQLPTQLDKVSATVNGKNAYVYYISPTQINILTPPDALTGTVQVVVNNNGLAGAAYAAQEQALSPSFFVFNGGPYVAAVHTDGTYVGPASLYPGVTSPASPNEVVMLYANGFGATNVPVQRGLLGQSGTLSPLPVVKIGGINASVAFAGLVASGEFQFNVTIPGSLSNGDQTITATYGGASTPAGTLITVHK